jgi:hypothetical protein
VFGSAKRDDRRGDEVPGPGGYNVGGKNEAPYIGFGTSARDTGDYAMRDTPGPGAYKAKQSGGKGITMTPRRTDLTSRAGKDTPGPGTY